MNTFFSILLLLSLPAYFLGMAMRFWRRGRRRGTWLAGVSAVIAVLSLIGVFDGMQREAEQAGFGTYSDFADARAAGVTSPQMWARRKIEKAKEQAAGVGADAGSPNATHHQEAPPSVD
ncbi:MAG: hypothetical protein AAGL24_29645 [Pseudomonadota bacterium]